MHKILITGFTGFTGKYVLQEARKRGLNAICFSEDGSSSSLPINLLDYTAVREKIEEIRPSSVVHLAAISHVLHEPASDFYAVNIGGTRNILQALSELSRNNLVNNIFASSANIYGNSSKVELDEETSLRPVNDYGLSKKTMEEILVLWKDKLPITITRPFNYTGRGQVDSFLIPKIVNAFKQKKNCLELGNLEISRDFSDVRFIAQAYLSLAIQSPQFRVINLCSGNLTSIKEIISICATLTNHNLKVISNRDLCRKNEMMKLKGSTARMEKALGYKSPYSIRETLSWMLSK